MKIQAAQLTIVLVTEFSVTSVVKNMHRCLVFIVLAFSLAIRASSVAPLYHPGSAYVLFMSPVEVLWMFLNMPQYKFVFSLLIFLCSAEMSTREEHLHALE